MEEEIQVVAFACRGTLVDWTGAIDAVTYELARRNGESPLDRGAALGRRWRRWQAMTGSHVASNGLPMRAGIAMRRAATSSLARVVAMARPLPGAREAVALAVRSGKRAVVVSRAESARALDPFGGAFDAVVSDPRELDAGSRRSCT